MSYLIDEVVNNPLTQQPGNGLPPIALGQTYALNDPLPDTNNPFGIVRGLLGGVDVTAEVGRGDVIQVAAGNQFWRLEKFRVDDAGALRNRRDGRQVRWTGALFQNVATGTLTENPPTAALERTIVASVPHGFALGDIDPPIAARVSSGGVIERANAGHKDVNGALTGNKLAQFMIVRVTNATTVVGQGLFVEATNTWTRGEVVYADQGVLTTTAPADSVDNPLFAVIDDATLVALPGYLLGGFSGVAGAPAAVPTLEQVLAAGNTATRDIVLTVPNVGLVLRATNGDSTRLTIADGDQIVTQDI